jgi:hypothetical protein
VLRSPTAGWPQADTAGVPPEPHRSLTVDNNVIEREATVRLRRVSRVATGTAWTVLLAAADASSEGPKCPSSRVLHGFGALAKPGAKRQMPSLTAWLSMPLTGMKINQTCVADIRVPKAKNGGICCRADWST